MESKVLPRPEQLNGTKDCELAALLATLGFTPADEQMSVALGDGVPGGRLGYWRFLPEHPLRHYDLKRVLQYGTGAWQWPDSYRCAAAVTAAFHNRRLLVESVTQGTRLRLVSVAAWHERHGRRLRPGDAAVGSALPGELYVLERVEARGVGVLPGSGELAALRGANTYNTELVGAMAALGFMPALECGEEACVCSGERVVHGSSGRQWYLPERNVTGCVELREVMAKYRSDEWCERAAYDDMVARMADGFYNLRWLRERLGAAKTYLQVKNGERVVVLTKGASARLWEHAERFLTR